MATIPPAVHKVLQAQKARLARVTDIQGLRVIKGIYDEAHDELSKKLRGLVRANLGSTFTAHQHRILLLQIQAGNKEIAARLATALGSSSRVAQTEAIRGLVRDIAALEKHFTGATISLPMMEAARMRGIIDGRRESLLRMHESSMARYGAVATEAMENRLSLSLVTGQTTEEAIAGVGRVAGGEWWRAERIVRTELAAAYNMSHLDATKAAREELPDLMMQWSEHVDPGTGMPLDDRVGVDSIAIASQVAPPGGVFTMPPTAPVPDANGETRVPDSLVGRSWTNPPNRPNDRGLLIPWRRNWGIPGWRWDGGRRVPMT